MPEPQAVPQGRPIALPGMGAGADGMPPLIDAGNVLLASGVPCNLVIGKVPTPNGEVGVATIRTTSATLTLTLSREDCEEWIASMTTLRDALSGSGQLQVASGPAKPPGGLWRPGQP